tara:strand:- start:55 stop:543 length:489 start_codon:yes stop_codon:yes gene_type:complete
MSKLFNEINKANEIREMLRSENDEQLTNDMIEGETDLNGLLNWAVGKVGDEEAMQESIKLRLGSLKARSEASINRQTRMTDIVKTIMDAMGKRKHTAPEATIFFSEIKPKNQIDSEFKFPEIYYKVEKTLDKTLVKKAIDSGDLEGGFYLSDGDERFTIRFN